jgi:hypothetical protein
MDNLQEFYLLFYDYDVDYREGSAGLPDLIYSVCLDKIPVAIAEYLAIQFETALGDLTGYRDDYVSAAKGFHDFHEAVFVIRPSQSFDESVKFLCARAMERLERDSKSDAPHRVVTFMQTVAQVARNYREKFLPSTVAERGGRDKIPRDDGQSEELPYLEKRNKRIYELACDIENYPQWDDVAATINKEFTEYEISKDAVEAAAKQYAIEHKLPPIPKRKPGKPRIN